MAIHFTEQFDIIVYCIVNTVYAVLAGINLVIFETAWLTKKDPSLKSCFKEKFFKVLIFLPSINPCVLLFDLQKKHDQ